MLNYGVQDWHSAICEVAERYPKEARKIIFFTHKEAVAWKMTKNSVAFDLTQNAVDHITVLSRMGSFIRSDLRFQLLLGDDGILFIVALEEGEEVAQSLLNAS